MNKLLSCRYNMDTNRIEARFTDGTTLAIDCIAVEDEYGNTPAQRAELDWLLYSVKGFNLRNFRLRELLFRYSKFQNQVHHSCRQFQRKL